MSTAASAVHPGPPLPLLRWALLVGLLLGEVFLLSLRFDASGLQHAPGLWAWAVSLAPQAPTVAVAVGVALLLFSGGRLRDEVRSLSRQARGRGRPWSFLIGHLAAFATFSWVTQRLLERNALSSEHAGAWFAAWVASALLTVACWAAVALPPAVWLPLARRFSALPLAAGIIVGAAAWLAGRFTDTLWTQLAGSTFALVRLLLGLVCPEVICEPGRFLIGTPAFQVTVAPECSGYEGVGLIWVFLGGYLWHCRHGLRFPHALLLLPLGTAAVYLANAGCIAGLVLVGTYLSKEAATGGFHSQAGWLAFNAVALGLVFCARRLRFFTIPAEGEADTLVTPNATAPFVVPLLVLVACTMLTTALSSGFDALYPLRVLAVGAVLWWYRREHRGRRWAWSWTAVALGTGVFGLWLVLEPGARRPAAEDPLYLGLCELPPAWAAAWLWFRVVGSVVTVPLAEELAFRGYLTRRLQARDFEAVPPGRFTWVSFLVTSAAFGGLHGRWLAGTLAGMVFAVALYRRGKVADAILAHATANALLAGYVLVTGSWAVWS